MMDEQQYDRLIDAVELVATHLAGLDDRLREVDNKLGDLLTSVGNIEMNTG